MKIEELIAGKPDGQEAQLAGLSLPVTALKKFMNDGYVNIQPYTTEKTFSMWGKACTGCFSQQEIINRI